MWICPSCHYENKGDNRFCIGCGQPRPQTEVPNAAKAPRPAKSKPVKAKPVEEEEEEDLEDRGIVRAILLLILALILVAAVVAILLLYPKIAGRTEPQPTPEVTEHSVETDDPQGGGSSTYVIGGDGTAPVTPAPFATPAPSAPAEPSPAPSEEAAPSPSPEATSTDYLLPDSSTRYLTEDDLKGLSWEQCTLARNEIYARHGRKFMTKEIAAYFAAKSWYDGHIEPSQFSESLLSEIERSNVNFIMQYETAHWGGSYY